MPQASSTPGGCEPMLPPFTKDPVYYYGPSDFRTIRAHGSSIIMQVNVTSLRKGSEGFDALLGCDVTEEGTDEDPLVIGGITEDDLRSLLCYLDTAPWDKPCSDVSILRAVLKISDAYIIPRATQWAKFSLENLDTPLPPLEQLHLAVIHGLHDWIAPAFRGALELPSAYFTTEMVDTIGLPTYQIIVDTRNKLDTFQRSMAVGPPKVPDPSTPPSATNTGILTTHKCPAHNQCQRIWNDTWALQIAPKIVHPTKALAFSQIFTVLCETKFTGMVAQCRQNVLAHIAQTNVPLATSDFFVSISEKIINSSVMLLLALSQK